MTQHRQGEPITVETSPIAEERKETLRELFPDVFAEGKVDCAQLKAAVGEFVDESPERYTFSWAGKKDAIRLLQTPTRATLEPARDESVNFDTTQNLFIEGDNLEVLKLLYKPYFGRVKMIYIDPPYNTGNDFIYPDNYTDPLATYLQMTGQQDTSGNLLTSNTETSGRYHSAWLSMMYPRLFLARQLMREDGIIFVSIDDHEVHNLRLVMNEAFGEENFIGLFVVQLNPRGRHLDRFVARTHEYLMVYARDASQQAVYELEKDERMTREYNKSDDQGGRYRELELRNRNPRFNSTTRRNLYYPIYVEVISGDVSLEADARHTVEVYPKNSKGEDSCWTWDKRKFLRDRHLLVGSRTSDGGWRIFRKDYLIRLDGTTATTLPKALWLDKELNNDYGKKAIQDLFDGQTLFDFPKSPFLIRKMLQLGTSPEDENIVLDFFAGSCTTAQAALEQNREDGGNRRFVMVQLPEPTGRADYPTIADIGKERIRRVIAKMKDGGKEQPQLDKVNGAEDLGFKVLKLAPSHFKPWVGVKRLTPAQYTDQMALYNDPLVDGWTAEGVIQEIALKEGYGLGCRVETLAGVTDQTVYRLTDSDREQSFVICLDDQITLDGLKPLHLAKDDLFVCRDSALDDEAAANLALQCRLKTI